MDLSRNLKATDSNPRAPCDRFRNLDARSATPLCMLISFSYLGKKDLSIHN